MPITLPPETRTRLIASLKQYAAEQLDEEILGKTPPGKSR
jgi:hypothetical protein